MLLDAAALKCALGLRQDAASLQQQALELAEAAMRELGLEEVQVRAMCERRGPRRRKRRATSSAQCWRISALAIALDAATVQPGSVLAWKKPTLRSSWRWLLPDAVLQHTTGLTNLGVAFAQAHPELINLYLVGMDVLMSALQGCAEAAALRQQLTLAEALLRRAWALVPLTRCLPDAAAQAALQLAALLRRKAMLGVPGDAWRAAKRPPLPGGGTSTPADEQAAQSAAVQDGGLEVRLLGRACLEEAGGRRGSSLAASLTGEWGGGGGSEKDWGTGFLNLGLAS